MRKGGQGEVVLPLLTVGKFHHIPYACVFIVALSNLTLCDPMDYSPLGSSVCGILQARILEWVAIPFSKGFSQSRDQTLVSCFTGRFFTTEPPGKPTK